MSDWTATDNLAVALRLEATYQSWRAGGYGGGRKAFTETPTAAAMTMPASEVDEYLQRATEAPDTFLAAVAKSRRVWVGVDHSTHWRYGSRGGAVNGHCGHEYICIDDTPPKCSNCGAVLTWVVRHKVGFAETLDRRVAQAQKRREESARRWLNDNAEAGQVDLVDAIEEAS